MVVQALVVVVVVEQGVEGGKKKQNTLKPWDLDFQQQQQQHVSLRFFVLLSNVRWKPIIGEKFLSKGKRYMGFALHCTRIQKQKNS